MILPPSPAAALLLHARPAVASGPELVRVTGAETQLAAGVTGTPFLFQWPRDLRVVALQLSTLQATEDALAALDVFIARRGGWPLAWDGQQARAINGSVSRGGRWFPLGLDVRGGDAWQITIANDAAAPGNVDPRLIFRVEDPT